MNVLDRGVVLAAVAQDVDGEIRDRISGVSPES